MILYIAEKPSVARAVAQALPGASRQEAGFIRMAGGDIITWCVGHLLENAEPEQYDPAYKRWRREHLPIIPLQWQSVAKPQTRAQLETIVRLIHQCDTLVHMGDPDRVGQILVDEVIRYAGVSKARRDAVQRCLIRDMNPDAIRRALADLQPNRNFIALSTSALARARADWLYGINLTRLCTLLGQRQGYQGVLSVGRVQTPVLGLVVARDEEITGFTPKPFYEVDAHLITAQQATFRARWRPGPACEPYQDEEGRVLSRALAENVAARITDQPAQVIEAKETVRREAPPLPYNLSALQIEAARRFKLRAARVLEICQRLYEQHKLLTYPRSDCRYLPADHHAGAATVIGAITATLPALQPAAAHGDLQRRSKAFDDTQISAHHAIIPTARTLDAARLSEEERQIYQLVAERYLMQFCADYEYADYRIALTIAGGRFEAHRLSPRTPGWKSLLPEREQPPAVNPLPPLQPGEQVHCQRGEVLTRETTPPRPFNDATLMAAMTGIARFVSDPAIKRILRATDGLGTEATRAGIVELLFARGYLTRKGQQIQATDTGRALIASLPPLMTRPDMTAHWEAQLEAISQKKLSYQQFIDGLTQQLRQLIEEVGSRPLRLRIDKAPAERHADGALRARKGNKSVKKKT